MHYSSSRLGAEPGSRESAVAQYGEGGWLLSNAVSKLTLIDQWQAVGVF